MIGLTRLDAAAPALGGNALTLAAVAVALIAFAALIPVERAAREPVISPALFGTRQLVVTYTLEVLIGMLEGALFFVPAALVAAQHLSYALAGIIAAVGAVVFVAIIPLAGRALDLYGSRIVLMAGAACTATGLALLGVLLASLPLALISMVVAGVGFGALLGAPTRYIITNEVPANMRATAVGLLSIFLIIGQILGGSLAGGVVGASISNPHAYRALYLIFASIALVVTCATSLLAPRARERSLASSA
jgi:MFS family permease